MNYDLQTEIKPFLPKLLLDVALITAIVGFYKAIPQCFQNESQEGTQTPFLNQMTQL